MQVERGATRAARSQVPYLPGVYEWAAQPPPSKGALHMALLAFYLGKAGRTGGHETLRSRFIKYTQVRGLGLLP